MFLALRNRHFLILSLAVMACTFSLFATEPAPTEPTTETTSSEDQDGDSKARVVQERVQVLGSADRAREATGSAHFISKQELERQRYVDIHRILRNVPGINIQEEDGYGLRPNIGIRGTGVERSQKITLMEDGVLVAPAPYTAPAAYYFPTAGRMESFEILKGSSSVKQGPYTNGGALNMNSTSIPGDLFANVTAAGGSDALKRLHANIGDSKDRFGWIVETFQIDTDGFKDLDSGGDTGSKINDYMGKFRFNSSPGASIYQSLELKAGKTSQFGDETYLGLTNADFAATPNRRYAGSQEDFIDTDHEQFQLQYYVQPHAQLDITTTLYRNNFARNWHKMEKTGGVSNASILANPDDYPLLLNLIRGEINSDDPRLASGELRIRNNNREYYSQGIQSVLNWQPETAKGTHEIEFGVRFHRDEEDRFQNEEAWGIFDGLMMLDSLGAPGSQTNRVSDAEALSFFLTDTFNLGKWSLRPGLRYESIDYQRLDYATTDPTRSAGPTRIRDNDVSIFLPGMGTSYNLSADSRVFFGLHRGFSPPGAGKNEETDAEESWNYEAGYRHFSDNFTAEVIGFFNDYDNLLGAETVSGGGDTGSELFNGGEVEVKGLEASLSYEFRRDRSWTIPFNINYTFTDSEFQSSFETGFADWAPQVEAGDELPYIPQNQFTANLGLRFQQLNLNLTSNYADEMRTTAGSGAIPVNQSIEDHLVFDLSANYQFSQGFQAFLQLRNLFDEAYAVSRRPYGLRPGLSRTIIVGLNAKF